MMSRTLSMTVDGKRLELSPAPTDTLADVLRKAGFTGIKLGCSAGDCGACTVLLDGAADCACLIPAHQAENATISTIHAWSTDEVLGRLVAAFGRHGAAQCGICTPGMIGAAAALLATNPAPTRAEIETAIGGVLCRCTGYVKIIDAIEAAANGDAITPLPAAGVGADAENQLAASAARGSAQFGADAIPQDALQIRVVRSPHASATFKLGDLDAFAARDDLAAVLTARDVPGANGFGIFPTTKDQPVFADGMVRFRGEAIAAIVGRNLARIDLTAFPVTWTPLPPLIGIGASTQAEAPAVHAAFPDNILTRGNLRSGDVARGHAAAAATVEGVFETSFVEHAYIEPEAGHAYWDGDTLCVVASTQAPMMDREDVARVTGLPEARVRIIPTACGGGFGGKLDVAVQPILAVAAMKSRRPVAIVYSRTESMASTTKRHPAKIEARASADREGRLLAYDMQGDFNTGAYASWGPTVANRVPIHAHGPYRVPHVSNRTRAIFTNETPAGAFRGFGVPQAAIANETLMDDLAGKLGLDRWQIRRINALGRGDRTASGQLLEASAGLPECLDALKPAWDHALATAAAHNTSNARLKRGAGIACMWYGCGNTALSNPSAMRIALDASGTVTIWSGAVDIGQGISTVVEQVVRETLRLDGAHVTVCDAVGDTLLTLDAGKTSASRQTFVSGNAARRAAENLRAQLVRLANVSADAPLAIRNGELLIGAGEARRVPLADLFQTGESELSATGHYDPPTTMLDENGQGVPYATYGFAAQIAEVLVDTALGTTKVLHIHAAHDVGRAINPMQVEGQIHGGIAQGLGLALMEEYISGRTDNLHDYLIPTAGDIPPITTHIIEDPDPEGPFGAKGVGEPALIATAPAILSAIRHATGVTIRLVPVLPDRLWQALRHHAETKT